MTALTREEEINSSPAPKKNHSLIEDFLAYICGGLLIAMGVLLFEKVGIITGGAAGMALILSKVSSLSFGMSFFVINLPFYALAWMKMGPRFTINSFLSVALVSFLSDYLYLFVELNSIDPLFASIMGGFLIAMGVLAFFRHRSSVGGVGIMAVFLQEKYGIRAGKFQMGVDFSILITAFFIMPVNLIVLSVVGAVAVNLMLTLNHKPGRYQIT
ncbi:YitT family protein [Thalassotalea litorea]|uniref:YitT family protein n=1 Tax=Thalassotalea litorea TaxID=2020715 RepID=A0A5R9ID27_9GAMM|nr:YitT family protein [Thalassotalea litorea]TLU61496.1 YitT family protein [Thalassotalea litorea]